MIKYGIEVAPEEADCPFVKLAGEKSFHQCEHPLEAVEKDGDVRFCKKCQKYLPERKRP